MDGWVLPLTILPGIGLLIMSTSNLVVAISNEISRLLEDMEASEQLIRKKISQMTLLNYAMVSLYLSIACFALSSLIGELFMVVDHDQDLICKILLVGGLLCLMLGAGLLIVYGLRAVRIKKHQFEERVKGG